MKMPPVKKKLYTVIYADPPWQCDNVNTGGSLKSGAAEKYLTMSTYDLCCMPIRYHIAKDSILFMWYLNSMPQDALEIGKAWGFKKFLSMNGIVWRKLTKNNLEHFGMGHCTRAATESVMVMYNGSITKLIKDKSIRNMLTAPMPVDENGKYIHSAKPPEAREIVEKLCGDVPRLEMFARGDIEDWDVFGNQTINSIKL